MSMEHIDQRELFEKKYQRFRKDISEMLIERQTAITENPTRWFPHALSEPMIQSTFDPFLKPDSSVLDVGCGVGASLLPFVSRGVTVLGIDFSRKGIERARKIYRNISSERIRFRYGNFFTFHSKKSFSVISMQTFLEHVSDFNQARIAFIKAKSLLSHGGVLYIYTVNKRFSLRKIASTIAPGFRQNQLRAMGHVNELFYDEADLHKLYSSCGFKKPTIHYVYPPIAFLFDLWIFPKILAYVLQPTIGNWRRLILKIAYDGVILPVVKCVSVLDRVFIRYRDSSGIIAVAQRSE